MSSPNTSAFGMKSLVCSERLLKVIRVFNAGWCMALSALPMPIFNITNWQLLLYMLHAENASKLLHIIPACVVRWVCSLNKSTNLHYWLFPVLVFSQNTDSRATAAFSKKNIYKNYGVCVQVGVGVGVHLSVNLTTTDGGIFSLFLFFQHSAVERQENRTAQELWNKRQPWLAETSPSDRQ